MLPDSNSTATHLSPDTGATHPSALQPPLALREPVEHVIHSDRRVDHYAWLRDKKDPRVLAYLGAENSYAEACLKSTESLQAKLYSEMLDRILQTDLTVPYTLRGFEYYTRTVEGQQYTIYCRKSAQDPAEQILLDLNALSEGHSFLGLGIFEISDDNSLLAYATDTTGFRQYTLEIKNLRDSTQLPLRVERVTSAAWAADNRTLFYVVEDETTKRAHQLYRHTLGSNEPDTLLYEEKDERFHIDVERSRSGAYLFLVINSHTTSEIHYLRADRPGSPFSLLHPRSDGHEYYVDHHPGSSSDPAGGVFFIRTNDLGRTFRLMTVPAVDPARLRWHEVVPNRPGVMLSGVAAFRSHLILIEREDGLPHLRIIDLTRETSTALDASRRISFAEPAYNTTLGNNPEFDSGFVRFIYESFITPRSVFDLDFHTDERTLRKQQPVLGGYDPTLYGSERLHATASDGTKIPVSIVYRHDTPRDGSAPLLLYGYGSYGISMPVSFSSNRLSLLDRGIVFAIGHIRGGGELGKPWHDAGRMHQKMNTFTDFISCAEDLITWGFAAKNKLIIEGGSAGGLLLGAVTHLRPDLFRAVVSHVPFLDVLNTMLDPSLPLTVGEYEEWGNPLRAEDYFYVKSYCPYTRLEAKDYPAMLVKTGLNDSQVMFWEPAKYVAKLRSLKTDANQLLLITNMGAGHGGASGRYDYLKEIALDYAFVLNELGISE
jgi:oligopeptidase B